LSVFPPLPPVLYLLPHALLTTVRPPNSSSFTLSLS
jgi:hypothetical protein